MSGDYQYSSEFHLAWSLSAVLPLLLFIVCLIFLVKAVVKTKRRKGQTKRNESNDWKLFKERLKTDPKLNSLLLTVKADKDVKNQLMKHKRQIKMGFTGMIVPLVFFIVIFVVILLSGLSMSGVDAQAGAMTSIIFGLGLIPEFLFLYVFVMALRKLGGLFDSPSPELIGAILNAEFGQDKDFSYSRARYIKKEVMDLGYPFKSKDQMVYAGSDCIQGIQRGIPFVATNETVMALGQPAPLFHGSILLLPLKTPNSGIVLITNDKEAKVEGLSRVETESLAFNKEFKVFADSPLQALQAVNPVIIDRLNALAQKGQLTACFHDRYLFVYRDKNSLDLYAKNRDPIENVLCQTLFILDFCEIFANDLERSR